MSIHKLPRELLIEIITKDYENCDVETCRFLIEKLKKRENRLIMDHHIKINQKIKSLLSDLHNFNPNDFESSDIIIFSKSRIISSNKFITISLQINSRLFEYADNSAGYKFGFVDIAGYWIQGSYYKNLEDLFNYYDEIAGYQNIPISTESFKEFIYRMLSIIEEILKYTNGYVYYLNASNIPNVP